jgi:hypothetical protein
MSHFYDGTMAHDYDICDKCDVCDKSETHPWHVSQCDTIGPQVSKMKKYAKFMTIWEYFYLILFFMR